MHSWQEMLLSLYGLVGILLDNVLFFLAHALHSPWSGIGEFGQAVHSHPRPQTGKNAL